MQASTFNEHKLVLGSFLQQSRGEALRDAAREYGASNALLAQLEEAFPGGLDFYVPSRGQRQAWVGTGRLLVAGVSDLDAAEALAFDTNGESRIISSLDVPGYDAIVAIHPAEPKTIRPDAVATVGATIESESEALAVAAGGTLSQVWCPYPDPGGEECAEPPPPPPPPPSDKTRVTSIYPDFDDGILGGDLELYFVTVDVNETSNRYDSGIFEAIPRINNTAINVTIFDDAASSALELRAVLWESDGFFGGSDDFKGEPFPVNIKGSGDFSSYDPFTPYYWAEYHVISNQY